MERRHRERRTYKPMTGPEFNEGITQLQDKITNHLARKFWATKGNGNSILILGVCGNLALLMLKAWGTVKFPPFSDSLAINAEWC